MGRRPGLDEGDGAGGGGQEATQLAPWSTVGRKAAQALEPREHGAGPGEAVASLPQPNGGLRCVWT